MFKKNDKKRKTTNVKTKISMICGKLYLSNMTLTPFLKKNLNKYNRYLIPLPSFYAIKVIYYESLITVCDNEYSIFFMQITALMFYLISFDTFYVGNKIMVCINKLKNVNV